MISAEWEVVAYDEDIFLGASSVSSAFVAKSSIGCCGTAFMRGSAGGGGAAGGAEITSESPVTTALSSPPEVVTFLFFRPIIVLRRLNCGDAIVIVLGG